MFAIHALTAIWCLAQQGWFSSSSSCSCSSPSSSGSTSSISSSPIHFLFQQFQPTVLLLEGDDYTKLGLAVVVLILEGLHAVCYRRVLKKEFFNSLSTLFHITIMLRKGLELDWLCPSVLLYLVAVCPPIWILELKMADIRCAVRCECAVSFIVCLFAITGVINNDHDV